MAFNRFSTIVENDDPCHNQKSFVSGDNPQMGQRRLTQIQARNQQTKPHLKSSYALEELPVDISKNSETYIKGEPKENRDFSGRMSLAGTSVLKRKIVDDAAKSPNKTPVKQQANKSTRFNTQL